MRDVSVPAHETATPPSHERPGSPPRVMHVAAVDFTVAKLLAPQLHHLREQGYDVRVVCRRTDDRYWDEIAPFRPIDLPFPRNLRPAAMLRAARQLSAVVRRDRPDVLHLHTPAASLPVRLLPRRGWSDRTRVFYTVHGYLHRWPPRGLTERVVQGLEQLESRRTTALLFQSEEDFAESTRRRYAGELIHLGNGVEDWWFDIESRRRGPVLQVLFVGRMVEEKGVLELLDAVSTVEGLHLHLAGEALPSDRTPVGDQVRDRMASPELAGRVHVHGMLSRGQLRDLYAQVDVLCLPSHREGVPRSVIEALAAGRPAVVTDIRGSRELVEDGSNGWVVPAHDASALARALRTVADLDAGALAAFGERARTSVDPERRESAVHERLVDSYRSIGLPPPT